LGAAEVVGAVVAEVEAGEARGAEAAPEAAAIVRRPGVAATPVEGAGEVEGAPVRALDLAVVADFVAELAAAREVAEELAAAKEVELAAEIDRQRCPLVAMSLETDQAESGIVQAASVVRAAPRIVPAAWGIGPVELVDLVVSGTGQAGSVAVEGPVVLLIDLASIDPEPELAIDPALEIDLVSEEPSVPVLERGLRIDRGEAIAHSSGTALGTEATDWATAETLPITGVIASRIAGIVLKTVRRTVGIVSTTGAIGWRTVATELKTVVIGSMIARTIGRTFTTTGTTVTGTEIGDTALGGTTTLGLPGVSVPQPGA
jgi:hypothetical protein